LIFEKFIPGELNGKYQQVTRYLGQGYSNDLMQLDVIPDTSVFIISTLPFIFPNHDHLLIRQDNHMSWRDSPVECLTQNSPHTFSDFWLQNGMDDFFSSAVLTSDGKNTNCDTVFVNTGGHRLAPGFQMRGYTLGTKTEPVTQPIYVECEGTDVTPGSTLTIPYTYVTGQYNYYEQGKNNIEDNLAINLDEITPDMVYPVFEEAEGLIQESNIEIVAINKIILTLTEIQRTDDGLQFSWNTFNPGEYPSYVHIGIPPVIGADGILYGFYETPDIVSVPITPATDEAAWTTTVMVPQNVKGFYIMLSVETGKARLFANYAVDITGG
jgi:hypothetical protein